MIQGEEIVVDAINGSWKSVIASLAKLVSKGLDTPISWPVDDRNELEGTIVSRLGIDDAERMRSELGLSRDLFYAAGSRLLAYYLPFEEEVFFYEDYEFFSTSKTPNVSIGVDEGVVKVVALRDIEKGEELTREDDELPNCELLRRYGITREENEFDIVEIEADIVTSQFALEKQDQFERIDWCIDIEILDDVFEIPISGKLPVEMLQVMHAMKMTRSEFEAVKKTEDVDKPDKAAWLQEAIIAILEAKMNRYKTTIEQDQILLQTAAGRLRHAIVLRLSEKRILRRAMERVRSWSLEPQPKKQKRS